VCLCYREVAVWLLLLEEQLLARSKAQVASLLEQRHEVYGISYKSFKIPCGYSRLGFPYVIIWCSWWMQGKARLAQKPLSLLFSKGNWGNVPRENVRKGKNKRSIPGSQWQFKTPREQKVATWKVCWKKVMIKSLFHQGDPLRAHTHTHPIIVWTLNSPRPRCWRLGSQPMVLLGEWNL
jgi:hypothetical protein